MDAEEQAVVDQVVRSQELRVLLNYFTQAQVLAAFQMNLNGILDEIGVFPGDTQVACVFKPPLVCAAL